MTQIRIEQGAWVGSGALRRCLPSWRLFGCLMLGCCVADALAACPVDAPKARVLDAAGLLGYKADTIAAELAAYQDRSGPQIYLVTMRSLDAGMSIEECAVTVFKHWALGQKGVDNGVLLMVAVQERKIRIEVGYGLEGTLTDAQSSRIIHDVMRPSFAGRAYVKGIEDGLSAIMAVLAADPLAKPQRAAPPERDNGRVPIATGWLVVPFIMILMVTQMFGIVGLFIFSIPTVIVAHKTFPGAGGYLLAAILCTVWCALRWRLIRPGMIKYRLKKARNKRLAWIWYFCAFGFATPERKPRRSASRASVGDASDGAYSFSFGGGSDGGSDSGGGDSSDSGGGSGGGGASGDW